MSRNRRRWRHHGRPSGVIINANRVIISRDEEDDPPRRQLGVLDFIFGIMAGMFLLRLIDLGKVIVLQ